jgi:hypothetical protein
MTTLTLVDFNIVRQHSAHFNRLCLARYRPLRKKALPRRDESIRPRIHVHERRFKNCVSSSLGQGTSVFSCTLPPDNHYGLQAIALFNANQQQEAMLRIHQLAVACPNEDILTCRVVQVSISARSIPGSFTD